MKRKKLIYSIGSLGLALLCSTQVLAQSPPSTDFKPLFDGKTLAGWKSAGGAAPYSVEDGAIVGRMTKGTPNSFLITEKEYADFILELDVKLEGDKTNSGIQTRSHIDPQANNGKGRVYGRQIEIDPSARAWAGGVYDEGRRGWLYPLDLNEPAKAVYKKNESESRPLEMN